MKRLSYNERHAQWVAEMRRKNPSEAQWRALWGTDDVSAVVDEEERSRALDLEETCQRLFGKKPRSAAERYDAEQAIDARSSGVKGRGED